jgi:adenylosuccinate synthase
VQKLLTSLGPVCSIIGAQWGDEGKGKVTDILAEHFDIIARACGGANAGHTIVVNGQKHVFHLLPSGCLHAGKPVMLGAGMVIHLPTLLEEIATLSAAGIDIIPQLLISHQAHILFDFHKEIDAVLEERRSKIKGKGIGTTKRGIGPAYMDKAARIGIRMEKLGSNMRKELEERAADLKEMYGITVDVEQEMENVQAAQKILAGSIGDVAAALYTARSTGKTVLVEGAQGTLLDIDHGTYPYVTSSSTTSCGALQGLGLPPQALTSCVGIAKAYCTRVGEGDFPTEVMGEQGDRLRERGGEYGATTGRPRRCGWLHLPDLINVARLNGITHWNITKLDVLDEEKVIPVGIGDKNGHVTYQELPGWQTSTADICSFAELPAAAQEFIQCIEKNTEVPVAFIGTGQSREAMIARS